MVHIKRLIIAGRFAFTSKAERAMFADDLTEEDVLESILNANGIRKTLRSTSKSSIGKEKLYVIESFTYDGVLVCTKGVIKKFEGEDRFYLLVSSKVSTSPR